MTRSYESATIVMMVTSPSRFVTVTVPVWRVCRGISFTGHAPQGRANFYQALDTVRPAPISHSGQVDDQTPHPRVRVVAGHATRDQLPDCQLTTRPATHQ